MLKIASDLKKRPMTINKNTATLMPNHIERSNVMGRKTAAKKTVKESIQTFGLKRVVSYMDKDPDNNIPKVLNWLDRVGGVEEQAKACREGFENKDGNWYRLIKSFWTDVDDGVRKSIFENFIVNATVLGGKRREKFRNRETAVFPGQFLWTPPQPAIFTVSVAGLRNTATS